jgi:TRAP-type C4-dicarboxylate transport system substrate-binding protein
LLEFGVGNSAKQHYLLEGGAAPLLLVMSRKTFDGLPAAAKAIIVKHSGERAAMMWVRDYGAAEVRIIDTIKADPARHVIAPSAADLRAAKKIYRELIDVWLGKNERNRQLLSMVESELAAVRAGR